MKLLTLFMFGGVFYAGIEVLVREWTHISMFITGGICFVLIGLLKYTRRSVLEQMLMACAVITVLELICGLLVNVWWGMEVWDYSDQPWNFMGQICANASAIWLYLSFVGIYANELARRGMFKERVEPMRILP